jgi:hypothetical protein
MYTERRSRFQSPKVHCWLPTASWRTVRMNAHAAAARPSQCYHTHMARRPTAPTGATLPLARCRRPQPRPGLRCLQAVWRSSLTCLERTGVNPVRVPTRKGRQLPVRLRQAADLDARPRVVGGALLGLPEQGGRCEASQGRVHSSLHYDILYTGAHWSRPYLVVLTSPYYGGYASASRWH